MKLEESGKNEITEIQRFHREAIDECETQLDNNTAVIGRNGKISQSCELMRRDEGGAQLSSFQVFSLFTKMGERNFSESGDFSQVSLETVDISK